MSTTFAQRLRRSERMVGTFVAVAEPSLAEMLAAEMDLLVVDLEHGAITVSDLQAIAIAAHGHDCDVLVRVPDLSYDGLTAVLDAGVAGIVAPRVDSATAAAEFVGRLRYPPLGSRGFGPRRANAYGAKADYWRSPAAEIACLAQIESAPGVEAAAEIAGVDGVDCLLLGPADLSFELGAPLDTDSVAMREAARSTQRAAEAGGVAFALASNSNAEAVRALVDQRCSVLIQGIDMRIYSNAVHETAARARAALTALEAPVIPGTEGKDFDHDDSSHDPGRAVRPAN